MLPSVLTRHSADCKFAHDRSCRRCNCPKYVGGQVNGYYFRQSAKTRQWAAAEEFRITLEEALLKGLPPFGVAAVPGNHKINRFGSDLRPTCHFGPKHPVKPLECTAARRGSNPRLRRDRSPYRA